MRVLEVSNHSKKELNEIRKYTTIKWGKKQSDKYLTELHKSMALLQENPLYGINKQEISNEIYSFPHASHMIYYKFNHEKLYIMAVIHKSMLPKDQLQGR